MAPKDGLLHSILVRSKKIIFNLNIPHIKSVVRVLPLPLPLESDWLGVWWPPLSWLLTPVLRILLELYIHVEYLYQCGEGEERLL